MILEMDRCSYGCPHTGCVHDLAALLAAQAHATLALAATQVDLFAPDVKAAAAWGEAVR